MSEFNDGGSAFPQYERMDGGMTLRDYFAAKALPSVFLDFQTSVRNGECEGDRDWMGEIARLAYGIADAMLGQREKDKP